MRNKFTITISDINGSKHYLLHQIIKRFVLYFTLFLIAIIISGSLLITFLMDEVTSLEFKKSAMTEQQKELNIKTESLTQDIDEKSKELYTIKEKVAEIEMLIGVTTPLETQIDARLENIKLTSAQQRVFFDNIPSGHVLKYNGFTSKFGWREHPVLKKRDFHKGIDYRAKIMTPVYAPANGVVEFSGYHKGSGLGNLVIIDHNFGFRTSYAHLSKKFPVKTGTFVRKGDLIAYTGNSGLSSGPHLHYEVRFLARPLDPINFIKWDSSNFEEIFKKEKRVSWQSLINLVQSHPLLAKQQ